MPSLAFTNTWELSAEALQSPPALRLNWKGGAGATNYIQRRVAGTTNWTSLDAVAGTTYLDTNIVAGERYDYYVNVRDNSKARYAHERMAPAWIQASAQGRPIEDRGVLVLLVDQTLAGALGPELAEYRSNLVGDGWRVERHDVPRHIDDYAGTNSFLTNFHNITKVIKPLILSAYAAHGSGLKCVSIVGHVSIPYTGYHADDGHYGQGGQDNHQGAWASDLYYADMDGVWRDWGVPSSPSFGETVNLKDDGKFYESDVPPNAAGVAQIEVPVGRIDFARLPVFPQGETGLLRQYFAKNNKYRHGLTTYEPKVDYAGGFANSIDWTVHQNAFALGSLLWQGEGRVARMDGFMERQGSALWACISGPGGLYYHNIPPVSHQTLDFADPAKEPHVGFYLLLGSWFPDWNLSTNNFMRATLATPNHGLAAIWTLSQQWQFQSAALGDTLASAELATINGKQWRTGWPQSDRSLLIQGDPALRLQVLAPPGKVTLRASGGRVRLSWPASPEKGAQYFVYRAASPEGPFTRLTPTPLTTTSYTDSRPAAGAATYQVRALKLVTTGSGSYTNLSQGKFAAKP